MQDSIPADIISFNTSINACAGAGNWQVALSLLERLPAFRLRQEGFLHYIFTGRWHDFRLCCIRL